MRPLVTQPSRRHFSSSYPSLFPGVTSPACHASRRLCAAVRITMAAFDPIEFFGIAAGRHIVIQHDRIEDSDSQSSVTASPAISFASVDVDEERSVSKSHTQPLTFADQVAV